MQEKDQAIQFVTTLLGVMINRKASDMFITEGLPPSIKVDGKIQPIAKDILSSDQVMALVRSIMNDKQNAEYDAKKEINFAINPGGIGRFRVNAYVQQGSPAMVLRTINATVPTLDQMKLPEQLKDLAMTKRGLIIFVGGTGTGKTTTLAALVNHRNENDYGHIITLEDPIEFVHPHKNCVVSQREIGTDSEDWEIALKNTLRQAPDVILMGEIRDRETMDHAIQFSETGHLCLATLHANSANQALDRIVNFFPHERHTKLFMDLSMNLKAMISQRLVPKEGSKGRIAAIEILLNSPLMSDLISKGDIKEVKSLMKASVNEGMQTFDQHLFDLYEKSLISKDDALRFADSVNDVRLKMKLESQREKVNYLDEIDHLALVKADNKKR